MENVEAESVRLRNELEIFFENIDYDSQLLAFWIDLGYIIQKLFRLKTPPRYWLSAEIFFLFVSSLSLGIIFIFGENYHRVDAIILACLLVIALTPIVTIALQSYFRMMFEAIEAKILLAMNQLDDLQNLLDWLDRFFNMKKRSQFGLIISVLLLGITYLMDVIIDPALLNFGSYLFLGTMFFITGVVLYLILHFLDLAIRLGNYDLWMFNTDPMSSKVFRVISSLFNRFIFMFSVIFALLTILSVFIEDLAVPFFVVIGWIPITGIFIITQWSLRKLVTRAKTEKLDTFHKQIEKLELLADPPSKETIDHIRALLDYHDYVKKTGGSGLNITSVLNFINSLVIPLVAFLLANLDKIFALRTGN